MKKKTIVLVDGENISAKNAESVCCNSRWRFFLPGERCGGNQKKIMLYRWQESIPLASECRCAVRKTVR